MHVPVREVAGGGRRFHLHYHAFSGSFTLTYPRGTPEKQRRAQLEKWAAWMETCLREDPPPDYRDGSKLLLLGRERLVLESGTAGKRGVRLEDDLLYLDGSFPEDPRARREAAEKLLSPVLLEKAREAEKKLRPLLGLGETRIEIRTMRSRWGTCFPSKGKIHLSRYLLYKLESFLQDVVLHEMAHFLHPNHQKAFKELVKRYKIG